MSKDFTEYTILVPTISEPHVTLIAEGLRKSGYHCEILRTEFEKIMDYGLRFVHNDMCYPALIVIGQFIEALSSGRYDLEHTAVLLPQTGGGCRASNYIFLLRKALERSGFGYIPVISMNAMGLDENTLKIPVPALWAMVNAVFYGDFLKQLYNQARSYEVHEGDSSRALDECVGYLISGRCHSFSRNLRWMAQRFEKVERNHDVRKPVIGIVGEIYLKYSPIGNNHLEDFLVSKGAEPCVSSMVDFFLYGLNNQVLDHRTYSRRTLTRPLMKPIIAFAVHRENLMNRVIEKYTGFRKMHNYYQIRDCAEGIIDRRVKMGEGWLLSAEIAAYIKGGIDNVIIAQPFGCLPNHVVARGAIANIRRKFPEANVVSVDYDPSASRANQENRINLMLMNARKKLDSEKN